LAFGLSKNLVIWDKPNMMYYNSYKCLGGIMTLWLVRAGRYGEREDFALENNLAVIGWDNLPDLSRLQGRVELAEILTKNYPDEKAKTRMNWESQIWPFVKDFKKGDLVAMPLKHRSFIVFGKVIGDYQYQSENPGGFRHTRPVNWFKEVPRNQIDQDLLYSLGAAMTVCTIRRNDAENRIRGLLSGEPTAPPVFTHPDADGDDGSYLDIEQFARDQISKAITKNFSGHKLAQLTAAILQAQGYKVRTSPEGPDGGVDIIAGRGPLGFESPRLVVQVKSGSSPVNVNVFRELSGVMDTFGAESGLIVAWGGYRGAVEKEAARQYFKIRLLDADNLVQMVQEYYDNLPEDIQSELPLKRIWILLPEDEE
jgi:restriction system protein